MSNEAFEKWFWNDNLDDYNKPEYEMGLRAWQAAKADSEKEIERLKAQVALDESLIAESTRTIQELEAHINTLREALLASVRYVPEYSKSLDAIQQALAKTALLD
jgi:septal ring factor EnvC (AmiA/AmiB activator)